MSEKDDKAPNAYPITATFRFKRKEDLERFIDGLVYGWGSFQVDWDQELPAGEAEEFTVDLLL